MSNLLLFLIFWIQIIELIDSLESEFHSGSISQQGGANYGGKFKEVKQVMSV